MPWKNPLPWLAAALLLLPAAARAEVVTTTHAGLTLNASLEKGKDWAERRVVLMTHGTLGHGGMEIMRSFQDLLKERGHSSLALTLSYGLDRRSGLYDCATPHRHRHTDAVDEIGAWVAWLKKEGIREIVLLGHSRGGNQTAWFVAERDDPAIQSVVLVAPMTYNTVTADGEYLRRYGRSLPGILDRAQGLIRAGKGQAWLDRTDFLYCKGARVTADAFVSYYDREPRFDTPGLLPGIRKPVLVIAGSRDESIPDVAAKTAPFTEAPRPATRRGDRGESAGGGPVRLEVIDGADHFFRDLYAEDTVDVIVKFLGRVPPG